MKFVDHKNALNKICQFIYLGIPMEKNAELDLIRVSRTDMGEYWCVASNGVPPTIRKRITLYVKCKIHILFHKCINLMIKLVLVQSRKITLIMAKFFY